MDRLVTRPAKLPAMPLMPFASRPTRADAEADNEHFDGKTTEYIVDWALG
jgi:hypothetical protein